MASRFCLRFQIGRCDIIMTCNKRFLLRRQERLENKDAEFWSKLEEANMYLQQ